VPEFRLMEVIAPVAGKEGGVAGLGVGGLCCGFLSVVLGGFLGEEKMRSFTSW
jgi:hypothetical protein